MFNTKKIKLVATLLALPFASFSQFTISGTVKEKKSNEPIIGASITIDNTFIQSQTKSDGSFEIKNLKAGTYIVHTSFIGYKTSTDTIKISENKTISIELDENQILMDEVIVSATRVDDKSAMAYNSVTKKQIAEQNLGQDLPYLLNQQTSIVTTSDAGNGVGYTGIRIRGVDATRINVTINGIPVNDAESQGTFWVNTPDLASSIDNIQIQRGVGTSTNGAGAFGGSLNIQTAKLNPKAYGEYNVSYGSFNTLKNTINAGTGLINDKFSIDARLSKITSDGFIDRASSDLKSYYLSAAYYGKKNSLKFITFAGLEKTYQAWYGIPESRLKGDVEGMNTYISNNGLDADEANSLLNSNGRTYNPYTYQNQIDHYQQDYYQLHFSHQFNSNWNSNIALHYTKGKGYYEEFKKAQKFSSYGLENLVIGTDTITRTDLVRRRWLDNDFYGTTFSLNYSNRKNLAATIGGAWNKYDGLHFGEIIWAQYASNGVLNQNYYKDTAQKTDFNAFVKLNYVLAEKLNIFADVQYRVINYSFLGFDNNLNNVQQSATLGFINPKIGLNYDLKPNISFYASYSIGNKEPSRNDYTESTPNSRPKHETLNDIEIGCKHKTTMAMWNLNVYHMQYKNQLVLTGEINDVGAYNRSNVANSYRQGIEAEFGVQPVKWFTWTANATLSKNKIKNFKEYIDNYDTWGQDSIEYSETDIAFSPSLIASSILTFEPIKNLRINYITKYVGKQFLDNTSNDTRKLNAYIIDDLRINYSFKTKWKSELGFVVSVNNIFNKTYESNGYTWGYIYDNKRVVENFYYPQAGTNFMAGLSLKF
ncbi:MAG: TonB-dependent receptor [Bacteroidia bacterium]|nr:TonB-dependent receptor [Bacteroidia bacterium]